MIDSIVEGGQLHCNCVHPQCTGECENSEHAFWKFIRESGYHLLIEMTIEGQPPRKSNQRRIAQIQREGKKVPRVIKSAKALDYLKQFALQVKQYTHAGLGSREKPLALVAVVYYPSYRSDLSVELVKDALEKNGVVTNDRHIREEHLWAFLSRSNPRILLQLYELPSKRSSPLTDGLP